MGMPNPTQIAANWQKGMAGSTDRIRQGIMGVTEAPTAKAARAVNKQVQGVIDAAASGKTERALLRVTLEDWRKAALDKGVNRISGGATAAQGKFAAFFEEFAPHLEQGMREVAGMPDANLEDRINRAVHMMRHNAKFRRRAG